MKIYTIWEEGYKNEMPWLVDCADEYSVEDVGFPDSYVENLKPTPTGIKRRELIIDIPEAEVRKLFDAPVVKGKVG